MILKIERYGDEQDWWILDDIRKMSKAQFSQPTTKDFSSEEADIFMLDYEDYLEEQGSWQNSRNVIKIICRLSNGS